MSAFLNQRLTNGGWDALSIALGGGRLTFYKMQAGSGTIANDAAIMGMTALVTPVCDIPITSYVIEGDGQITLFGNINSSEITTGFTFKELGVFATIEPPVGGKGGTPSGPNIQAFVQSPATQANPVVPPPVEGTALMYSYCNAYDLADYIPGSGESTDVTNTIQVTIKIDEAENVVINILQGEQFAVVNIGPPTVGAGPWSYTQANVAYLKRLVAGPMTDIHEDTNTITIGQRQLLTDLDLYVANGNPDISPNFSSIQKALNYLGQYVIPTHIRARINVSAGTYVSPTPIIIDHPNAQSITIQGPQNTTRTGTSLSITGSAYAWDVVVGGISDTSQFTVNSYAIIDSVAGISNVTHALCCGFFKVMAKTASSVTVRIPNHKSSFSVVGCNFIQITPISVMLTTNTLNGGVVNIGAYGIRLFQYCGVVASVLPTLSFAAVFVGGTTQLNHFGVYGFQLLINSNTDNVVHSIYVTANLDARAVALTYNQNGFASAQNGAISIHGCALSYNSFHGLWVDPGSAAFFDAITFIGGNGQGMAVGGGGNIGFISSVPAAYVICQKNDSYGVSCAAGGSLGFSNAICTLWLQDNNLLQTTKYDVVVYNYGLVNGSVCIIGTRIFNSPVGVINSSGGLIN